MGAPHATKNRAQEKGGMALKTAPRDGLSGRRRCFMRLRNEAQATIAAIA
jgi:hypothetical protein